MITPSQKNEIQKFLLTKRLPIKVLLEVKDHFICQINQLMSKQEMSFQEAFLNTKSAWDKDLSRKKLGFLWLTKAPEIVKSYQQQQNLNILRSTLIIALGYLLIQGLCALFLSDEIRLFSEIFLIFSLFILPVFVLFSYLGILMTLAFSKEKRSFYKLRIPFVAFIIGLLIYLFLPNETDLPINSYKIIHDYLNFGAYGTATFLKAILYEFGILFTWVYLLQIVWGRYQEYFKWRKAFVD